MIFTSKGQDLSPASIKHNLEGTNIIQLHLRKRKFFTSKGQDLLPATMNTYEHNLEGANIIQLRF